jgi:hypothetical protein
MRPLGGQHIGLGGSHSYALCHIAREADAGSRAGSAIAKEIFSPDGNGRLLIFGPIKGGTMCHRGRRWLL